MKVRYVGPVDAVEVDGIEFKRNHGVEVSDELAGHAPEERVGAAMEELRVAMEERDHARAAELRKEITELDYGEGLLAQDTFVVVAPRAKKDEEP